MSTAATISIGDRPVGPDSPVFVIAEAGVNHAGSLERALELVDGAKEAGADAVKFQTWDVRALYVPDEVSGKPLREESRQRNLSYEETEQIKRYCDEKGILFLSTPDERKSADFLDSLGVPAFKIGSGELTNTPFIEDVASRGKPVILSTGMATEAMIERAIETITGTGLDEFVVLHCVSSYPAELADLNLRYLPVLRERFDTLVGYSDHSESTLPAVVATVLGACVLEKHFTVDKGWPGRDNDFSYDVDEFAELVEGVRRTEEALGEPVKQIQDSERDARSVARKRIVARRPIEDSEVIEEDMLAYKRPRGGIPPSERETVIGKSAKERICKNETVAPDKLVDDDE
jgi:sialic acid synthase SpsE